MQQQQQQNDISSSYYQYFPNLNSSDPNFDNNPFPPAPNASAPPISTNSEYPPYPHNADHPYYSNPNLLSSEGSNQAYSFPHHQTPYYQYDQDVNYDHSNPPNPNSSLSSFSYSSTLNHDSRVPNYEKLNEGGTNYGGSSDDFNGAGVFPYNRGNIEPPGSRLDSSTGLAFDDYGRPMNISNGSVASNKIVKAVPKIETQQDVTSGVQKFRAKLLSEGGGQSDMDVLCQIGLDGIRILDLATRTTLKIYQLETVTRWEVLDSYIFAFWAKSSIDVEPRRIRLKSNSYTTNNILDTVAAAIIQFKEIAENNTNSDTLKASESEKKKGFSDWMNLMKPGNEEKDHWVPDEAVTKCTACRTDFGAFVRRHHCRNCGDIFCDKCTLGRISLTADESAQPVRVCDRCMAEVTQRLSNTKEVATKVNVLQSHEDLAKRLQEVMDKNRKTSTDVGAVSVGSDMGMREVECPTCTVHLQVKVPASGSETIECSVCQRPFLVSAH